MDKVQKELLSTYLRKRNIQVFTRHHVVKAWEYKYLKATGQLQDKHHQGGYAELVGDDASLFDEFREQVRNLRSYDLYYLLAKQPSLIGQLEHNLHTLDYRYVTTLIGMNPEWAGSYFKRFLGDLAGDYIGEILQKHPELIDLFREYLNKLSPAARMKLADFQPDLVGYLYMD